jgi:hypothetical protein
MGYLEGGVCFIFGGGRSRFIEAPTKGVVNNSRIITVSTALMYRSVLAVCKVWNL